MAADSNSRCGQIFCHHHRFKPHAGSVRDGVVGQLAEYTTHKGLMDSSLMPWHNLAMHEVEVEEQDNAAESRV
jgi:hypothetical protein